ncbi:MAG: PAS domain S-box protein [Xanthomonadales bacterium]
MNALTDRSEAPLDALMAAAADAMIIIDGQGRILRFNPAAEALFGYVEKDVLGRNVSLLMPEPHSRGHDGFIRRYLEGGEARIIGQGREVAGLRSDGSSFPMHLSVGEIRRPGPSHFVGIVRDLSEFRATQEQVRRLEEQLLHADRLVILGELTAGIAHEINQPLTAIAAYADAGCALIHRDGDAPQKDMQSICERIGEQSRRAAEVVQRLRKLVRSGTVARARHDINQIINNVLLLFEYEIKKQNIDLRFEPSDALERLFVDEIQIQQILVNLVKNGIDAIVAAGIPDGRIEIELAQRENEVLVAVSDNGPGVPKEDRSRMFEAFYTTKPKGVGLGLSICKSIAAAHGGSLHYAEAPGGGSRFTLSLPRKSIG